MRAFEQPRQPTKGRIRGSSKTCRAEARPAVRIVFYLGDSPAQSRLGHRPTPRSYTPVDSDGTQTTMRGVSIWRTPFKGFRANQATYGCGSKPMVPFWGRCTTHLVYFGVYVSPDWDGHEGYGILTHGHLLLFHHSQGQRCKMLPNVDPIDVKLRSGGVGSVEWGVSTLPTPHSPLRTPHSSPPTPHARRTCEGLAQSNIGCLDTRPPRSEQLRV